MRVIYKYVFSVGDAECSFDYYGCQWGENTVAMQDGMVCLWQVISEGAVPVPYLGKVVATGERYESNWAKVGTAFNPPLVWHLVIKPVDWHKAALRNL